MGDAVDDPEPFAPRQARAAGEYAKSVQPRKNFIVFRVVNDSTAVRTTRTGPQTGADCRGNGARPLSSPA